MSVLSRHLLGLLFATALLTVACASDAGLESTAAGSDSETVTTQTTPEPEDATPPSDEPPPLELSRGGNTVSLDAWTYCWTPPGIEGGICADGAPPDNPELLEGDGPITLNFPHDFNFSATIYDAEYAAEVEKVAVTAIDGGWQIEPTAEGSAVLEVFGNGVEGDVIISVAIG